ncbi:NACHT C-terminal helical domain 2-containing protein [Phormidesmis priestleyi]
MSIHVNSHDYDVETDTSIVYYFDENIEDVTEPNFKDALLSLAEQRPSIDDATTFEQWAKNYGQAWVSQLKNLLIQYRSINHDWKFSTYQIALISQYCQNIDLLIKCLNLPDSFISRSLRKEIEDTLLLPIAEIQKLQLVDLETI